MVTLSIFTGANSNIVSHYNVLYDTDHKEVFSRVFYRGDVVVFNVYFIENINYKVPC